MAIRTWQHYFEGEKPDSNPNESFYNLSGTNQLRIQAKRALETDNIEFFFSEDGTTIQHHLAVISAVPQFDRQRDTVSLNDFLEKLHQVLIGPYYSATDPVKIQFLETKMSPAAKLWFKGLNPPTSVTVDWYIDRITSEHQPNQDEESARKELRTKRLASWPADRWDSFVLFSAIFDSFLPRLKEMDRITKLETLHLCIGDSFYQEIAKQVLAKQLKKPSYEDFKTIGNELWATGIRGRDPRAPHQPSSY